MNYFFINYQKDDFTHKTVVQWRKYGTTSLKNLLYYLGYPPAKTLYFLDNYFNYETVGAGKVLLREGDISDKLYFIIKGTVKIGRRQDNIMQPFMLLNDGNFAVSFCDFLVGGPSLGTIETNSTTRLIWIGKEDYNKVVAQMDTDGMDKILNAVNYHTAKHVAWFYSNVFLNSKEKVHNLYSTYPDIFSLFSDSEIAAFLGMARETFSRMKKEVFRGQRVTG